MLTMALISNKRERTHGYKYEYEYDMISNVVTFAL